MAASYTWPTTLPQKVQRGYTETVGMNILRTAMDAGPAKMRRRSIRPDQLNVSFTMTTAQVTTLDTFLTTSIKGTARFYFPHPRKETTVEVRIVPTQDGALYNLTNIGPGFWTVALQLEVLP